ncbi:MAG: IS701 family transposase [Hyphomicrobiales bacterium]
MTVAEWSGSLLPWAAELSRVKERLSRIFGRREAREAAWKYLDGLLSGIERKTGWQLAERAGDERPFRIQGVLGRDRWDAEAMRELVRAEVIDALGDAAGVLVVDETGFIKKGEHSVGVARQYSGTAGRIENCQVGVFLAYASRFGQALIDRQLYLPEAWAGDAARREKTYVPQEIGFATKPTIARRLIARALDAGVPCAFVLGDAVYGSDKSLRMMLEAREKPYVLAVRGNEKLMIGDKPFRTTAAAAVADALAPRDWVCHAAGEGSKGPRLYDWARVRLFRLQEPPWDHWLLIRRSRKTPKDRAYYVVFARAETTLAELAGVAGLRWTVEECFLRAKDDLGLDHCEARSWTAWHRHMTLCMAALAFLAGLSADLRRAAWSKPNKRSPAAHRAA